MWFVIAVVVIGISMFIVRHRMFWWVGGGGALGIGLRFVPGADCTQNDSLLNEDIIHCIDYENDMNSKINLNNFQCKPRSASHFSLPYWPNISFIWLMLFLLERSQFGSCTDRKTLFLEVVWNRIVVSLSIGIAWLKSFINNLFGYGT